ncbi:MAG: type II secretion system F family protein [Candidatus Omnitrophica bacterium]|nr:type II secretion system F family protein [Candidatus Omnitrophota bacterium]
MPDFSYTARDNSGKLVTGTLDAKSKHDAVNKLRQIRIAPIEITKTVVKVAVSVDAPKTTKTSMVKVSELTVFCVNLSSMLSAGITLAGALMVISDQLNNSYFREVVRKMRRDLSEGSSFSDTLAKFPDVFSKFFVNLVRVGELTGTMDGVLKTLATNLERQEDLSQKFRGAMIYPAILMVAGTAVILLIITFVLPQFVTIFKKANVPLPFFTKLFYELSMFIRKYWFFLITGIGGTVFLVRKFLSTKFGKDFWQTTILKLPLFGPLVCSVMVARFCRTLAVMLNAGVPILQALNILKEVLDNVVFAKIVEDVYNNAERGEGLHKALEGRPEFPKDVMYMISVGEKTGNVGMMLNKAADFYESKVEYMIKGLMVYIEPVFICVLGACVGCILASVLLPMFDMVKTIQQ